MEQLLIIPLKTSVKNLLFKQVVSKSCLYFKILLSTCVISNLWLQRNIYIKKSSVFYFYVKQTQHTRLAHYKIIPPINIILSSKASLLYNHKQVRNFLIFVLQEIIHSPYLHKVNSKLVRTMYYHGNDTGRAKKYSKHKEYEHPIVFIYFSLSSKHDYALA